MSKLSLKPHRDSRSPVKRIEVEVAREASGSLRLTYQILGSLDRVKIPPTKPASRTDALWKHTCFEAFLGAEQGYYEFNFSPSSQWAAYRFDRHREGMREAAVLDPSFAWREDMATLVATLHLPPDATGPLGLSAIIEDKDGNRSFWALAHPPGSPDFHHPACFAAELPPAD